MMTDKGMSGAIFMRMRRTHPLIIVLIVLLVLWYLGALLLNQSLVRAQYERLGQALPFGQLLTESLNHNRPLLPAPHQVIKELVMSTLAVSPTSRRSLLRHAGVTLSSSLLGLLMGGSLGVFLAFGIIGLRVWRRGLLPWIIASQTVPILAIAPMIIVVLAALGLRGLVPKAMISGYLCFFPITIGMVKGLSAADPLLLDLMRSYEATRIRILILLRLPSSAPFFFASLKIAAAVSIVGAIVGELPTGAVAGLGARLLAGSYYGQTVQIWSALVMAGALALTMVTIVTLIERRMLAHLGLERAG